MGMSVGALAAGKVQNASETEQNTTEIKLELQETYLVTIPDEVVLNGTTLSGEGHEISVKDVVLGENQTLSITVSSQNEWKLMNSTHSIDYEVKDAEGTLNGGQAFSGNEPITLIDNLSAGQTKTVKLSFQAKEESYKAATVTGEYTDTLTFNVSAK